ncbi:hypothetical protein AB0N14_13800 [Streptomyces sp. NPDC051104]|uniref:hypothetical protein n=1 Tax=Streptomyces sp. NPDC051104 TaxID=3155044 RepID=UPI00341E4996
MSAYHITVFLDRKTNVRGTGIPNPVLHVEPDGWHGPSDVSFQMKQGLSSDERVKIAEEFLKNVTAWRDQIVSDVERERTTVDELAVARAEIARLKAEAEVA